MISIGDRAVASEYFGKASSQKYGKTPLPATVSDSAILRQVDGGVELDRIKLQQLDHAIPILMDELGAAKPHRFKGLEPRSLINTVIMEDVQRGRKTEYFPSPNDLAFFVRDQQTKLNDGDKPIFVTGALIVSKTCHHATVVGLIKKREAAVMVLDSVPDLAALRKNTRNPFTKISHAASAALGGYDTATFEAFRNQPNTSVYYTYLGTQASMTDCAAFTVASTRHILSDPNEIPHYAGFLNQRREHVKDAVSATAIPGFTRLIKTPSSDESAHNVNFVLNGDYSIAPTHYLHTQSKARVLQYCAVSPFVQANPAWKKFLLAQNVQHRRAIKPAISFIPRFRAKHANISIRQEQLHALIEAREAVQARVDTKQAPS